jgi:ABC-type glycerol-3-phosphate transport system substrate-binding protein
MKNKGFMHFFLLGFVLFMAVSCSGKKDTQEKIPVLRVWHYNNELPTFIQKYYLVDNPNEFVLDFTMVDQNEWDAKLDSAIASGDAPDFFGINTAEVKKYVESGALANMDYLLPKAKELKLADYTVSLGTDSSGVLRSLSFQACPGVVWYRRSIAQKYLGVSEPEDMQFLLGDLDQTYDTAKRLYSASDGNVFYCASLDELWYYFSSKRTAPFVVNDKIVIDKAIEDFFDYAKKFMDESLVAGMEYFSQDWYSGLSDSWSDASGKPKQIFCYTNGPWFGNFIIQPNSKSTDGSVDTFGDWGIVKGPSFFFNGGTHFGVNDASKNIDTAKRLFEYLTLNVDFIERLALDSGDYPACGAVSEKLGPTMSSSLLNGQNQYAVFNSIAGNIRELYTEKYFDELIQNYLVSQAYEYAIGHKNKETATNDYINSLTGQYPDLSR